MSDPLLPSTDTEALVARLADEMAQRWSRGERPAAEEMLAHDARLAEQPEPALELIYEEFCLRRQHGEPADAEDFLRRFPRWRTELEVMLGCHRLLERRTPPLPEAGEVCGGFRLLRELGRGARGRVFLASQPALADRPVVVKVTPCDGREHLSLARLQHTHIVPLYGAHDDNGLRLLCMPYFGGATLAQVLDELAATPPARRTGHDLVAALDRAAGAPEPADGPARRALARSSYPEAVCRIALCLADALRHAHERGLIHLDLKPSNVLLAADGTPMLLDFHLAHEPLMPGGPAPRGVGGTPGYMAPELWAAMNAAVEGLPTPSAVDGRADLFSLGLLVDEALGGRVPGPLRERNAAVSVGLADVVARCHAPRAEERYADAAALADDVRRHLGDRPLRGVPNRSPAEWWRKWRRRRPHTFPLACAAAVAVVAVCLAAFGYREHQHTLARGALERGAAHQEAGRFAEAAESLRHGLAALVGTPLSGELERELSARLRQAQQTQDEAERRRLADELHRLADELRFLHGSAWSASSEARRLERRCGSLWAERRRLVDRLGPGVGDDLVDLALLWADLRVALATESERVDARRAALLTLAEAEDEFGPSHTLHRERQVHAAALGLVEEARTAGRRAEACVPRTAWEYCAVGRALLRPRPTSGEGSALLGGLQLLAAAQAFERAVELEPRGFWPNYYRGLCAYRLGRYDDAVSDFSLCLGAGSPRAELFLHRATAYSALGRADRALRDRAEALRLAPGSREALAAVSYNLAVNAVAGGDADAARAHAERALRDDPQHVPSRGLLGRLRHDP